MAGRASTGVAVRYASWALSSNTEKSRTESIHSQLRTNLPTFNRPSAVMSESKAWSGPGAILSFFKLREPARISPKTLEDWFDQEFVPALLESGAVSAAWQYQAANEGYDKQQVILYKVPDLGLIQAGKFQIVPRTSKQSLFEGPVDDYIEVDTRVYSFAQLYETSRRDAGKPNHLRAT